MKDEKFLALLSRREQQVVELLLQGLSNKQVAMLRKMLSEDHDGSFFITSVERLLFSHHHPPDSIKRFQPGHPMNQRGFLGQIDIAL